MRNAIVTTTLTALIAGTIGMMPGQTAGAETNNDSEKAAQPAPAGIRTISLVLTRNAPSGTRRVTAQTTLTCEPTGGRHPNAEQACQDLLRSGGSFELPPGDVVCPMIYTPVTVTATGRWDGQPKRFRKTYSNGCDLSSRTGSIFGF